MKELKQDNQFLKPSQESPLPFTKAQYEYLRNQAKQYFNKVRGTWIECGQWAAPHRTNWMLSNIEGERNNQHIVDSTHIIAKRSFVAGFLEGNTSASRPWYRVESDDEDKNKIPANREWLQIFTRRTLSCFSNSNFYNAAATGYDDIATFNTGAYYIDEVKGKLFFHNLVPGSYFVINNYFGDAVVLVREMSMTVMALVEKYGQKKNGKADWSNFSNRVKVMYENGNYTQLIDIVHIVKENEIFDPRQPVGGLNRQWISCTYELGGMAGQYYQDGQEFGMVSIDPGMKEIYLNITASKRKPFVVAVSERNSNFEYGEVGPTTNSLGLIKSANKKAIGKDQALEHMLRPPMQGPANLRKSYITTAPNSYVPLDPTSLSQKGIRSIFDINPGIGPLVSDVEDIRSQIEKHYYADYLLYLSRNPKTRTATETNAVVQEQQLVIGPMLQSLSWTHNVPLVHFVMDYVLFEDPMLPPPPPGLAGSYLSPTFISVFAQAMKAADLPTVDRFAQAIGNLAQIPGFEKIADKLNVDKYADIYDDRLFLPAGLNNPQAKVDAMRQQAAQAAARNQALTEHMPALSGVMSDMGMQPGAQPQGGPQPPQQSNQPPPQGGR